ncbi:Transposase [Aliiroseovarius crassostreae]|nr:Transposase [Aliiroseovarius crassostreae]
MTDALGNLADFCLLPGQAHDLRGVPDLLNGLDAGHMLADRAFDADWLRHALSKRDIAPVIPPRKKRKHPASYDEEMYKWRHLVENFFQKIKDYRGIATRYCKTDTSFKAFISIAATILWLKGTSTNPKHLSLVCIFSISPIGPRHPQHIRFAAVIRHTRRNKTPI